MVLKERSSFNHSKTYKPPAERTEERILIHYHSSFLSIERIISYPKSLIHFVSEQVCVPNCLHQAPSQYLSVVRNNIHIPSSVSSHPKLY
ncbi:hypothetical protein O181_045079 [Austropuccinia psidii MF-1]|uniref:Uncharacterized protein n=1 Tax=Austropuccinia psidii MF-1 TaxID=1389203 RepID=A0A9Q3DLH3_9BASI|nr:hypothetical protein [Austropuccinia psidii MF-1]